MISSITMRDVAAYNEEGVTFDGMDKVNLIFGSNGTGKTTISSFMKAYGDSQDSKAMDSRFDQCDMEWTGDKHEKILVYNRQFKEENIGQTSIPGVFLMGKDAVDASKEIEKLEKELEEKKKEADELRRRADAHRASVKPNGSIYNTCMNAADKAILHDAEELHYDTLKGFKRDSAKRLEMILQVYNSLTPANVLSKEELEEHIKIAKQGTSTPIPVLVMPDLEPLLKIEKDAIWSKAIIGSQDIDIAELINRLNLSDWVKKGKDILPHTGGVCPFCQQPINTDNLLAQLNNYFNESYEKDIEKIKDLAENYQYAGYAIAEEIKMLKESEHIDSKEIDDLLNCLTNFIENNVDKMYRKIDFPSDRVTLNDCMSFAGGFMCVIHKANHRISEWNALIIRQLEIKRALPQHVLEHVIYQHESNIKKFIKEKEVALKKAADADERLEKTDAEITELKKKISDLRAKSTDSTAAVERINKILEKHHYKSFKLISHDDSSYRIVRKNGDDASKTLSEGEETLLTFLYYMQLLEGSTNPRKKSGNVIAVIDDPISSLDNQILTFIAREIKDLMFKTGKNNAKVKQLIILTHNIDFHKSLAKSPVCGGTKTAPLKAYYILEKVLGAEHTSVQKSYNPDKIESEYNKMWSLLKQAYQKISETYTEEEEKDYKYTIQNTMRRIYETFFSNTCGLRDSEIAHLFTGEPYTFSDCMNLIEWLNIGSHSVSMTTFSDLPSDAVILDYLNVFKEMFRVTGNIGQFERLMGEVI